MASLRFAQFSGEIPRLIARLLPDTGSQYAENVRLDDGGLTPIRKPRLEHQFEGIENIQTVYKFGSDWLAWDAVVNAVPGPVATDRLYYTGDGVPKMRIGSTVYDLAVPAPTTALSGAVTGSGAGDVITRLYVYTFVTDFGEESEPCPISADINWQAGQTVTLSGFEAPPSGRAITKQRIYRSQTSNQAGTDLFFLEERTAVTTNWVDTYAPDAFGEVLPSRDFNPPPDDLHGLISMPNGMLVGFSGKQLCFSEPFIPHAWPEKYRLTSPYEIVGLGSFGTTVVAGTRGYPFVASGNAPESMIEEKIEVNLPCVNGRGVVDLGYSVAYPSNDGLVVVSSGGASIVTDKLYTRPDWQKLSPVTLLGGQYAGRYFASYEYVEIDGSVSSGVQIIDLTGDQPFVLRGGQKAEAFHYNLESGSLFVLYGKNVYEWDAIGQVNEIMTWRSKRVVLPAPASFGAILVDGGAPMTAEQKQAEIDAINAVIAANALKLSQGMGSEINGAVMDGFAFNGDSLPELPQSKFISVSVYADGELVRVVTQLNKVCRINGSKRAKNWEIQVNGTAEVEQITIATTVRELNET